MGVSIALRLLPLVQLRVSISGMTLFQCFNRPQALTISATPKTASLLFYSFDVSIALRLLPLVQLWFEPASFRGNTVSIALRLLPLVQHLVIQTATQTKVSIALRLLPLVQQLPQLPNISAQPKARELPFFRKPIFCIFIPEVCEKMFNPKRPLMSRANPTLQKL